MKLEQGGTTCVGEKRGGGGEGAGGVLGFSCAGESVRCGVRGGGGLVEGWAGVVAGVRG